MFYEIVIDEDESKSRQKKKKLKELLVCVSWWRGKKIFSKQ